MNKLPLKIFNVGLCLLFLFQSATAFGQSVATPIIYLPTPGVLVNPTRTYSPAMMKGLQLDPNNPLNFNFYIDPGESGLSEDILTLESEKLIKYFLTTLTIPDDDLWVNLSPNEKDRIVPGSFGRTEMGRDLLSQDYILKQLTASLMYPEKQLGQNFWEKVYEQAMEEFGTTDIPTDTFHKVWILPDSAVVYENGQNAFVADSHLKVMLEQDYLSTPEISSDRSLSTRTIKEIIIPEIEKEVNHGKHFANLRQIYNSMILATWLKRKLKDSLFEQLYVNKNKINGVTATDKEIKEKIYQQYIHAFKMGVYDYIKEDYDPVSHQIVPRKYFSGGAQMGKALDQAMLTFNSRSNPIQARKLVRDLKNIGLFLVGATLIAPETGSTSSGEASVETTTAFKSRMKKIWLEVAQNEPEKLFENVEQFIEEDYALELLKTAITESWSNHAYEVSGMAYLKSNVFMQSPNGLAFLEWLIQERAFDAIAKLDSLTNTPAERLIVGQLVKNSPDMMFEVISPESPTQSFYSMLKNKDHLVELISSFGDEESRLLLVLNRQALQATDIPEHLFETTTFAELSAEEQAKIKFQRKIDLAARIPLVTDLGLTATQALRIIRDDALFIKHILQLNHNASFKKGDKLDLHLGLELDLPLIKLTNLVQDGNLAAAQEMLNPYSAADLFLFLNQFYAADTEVATFQLLFDNFIAKSKESKYQLDQPVDTNESQRIARTVRRFSESQLKEVLALYNTAERQALFDHLAAQYDEQDFFSPASQIKKAAALVILSNYIAEHDQTSFSPDNQRTAQHFLFSQAEQYPRIIPEIAHMYTDSTIQQIMGQIARNTIKNDATLLWAQNASYYIDAPWGHEIFTELIKQNPFLLKFVPIETENIQAFLESSDDPLLKSAIKIYQLNLTDPVKEKVFLLMDSILSGQLSVNAAVRLTSQRFPFIRSLTEIQARPNSVGQFAIKEYLEDIYLKLVREINDLHESPHDVRFRALANATDVELYNLMVFGEAEIYTSSFNGIFGALLESLNASATSGDQLLQKVGYRRFRNFIRLLSNFDRLNDFLATMTVDKQNELLSAFISDISSSNDFLAEAAVVAEVIASLENKRVELIQRNIRKEYEKAVQDNNLEARVIYGTFAGLFSNSALFEQNWFSRMGEEYPMQSLSNLKNSELFNKDQINVQRYYFYSDEDGRLSFENFLNQYRSDSNWEIVDHSAYVQIRSTAGKKIEIFANKPDDIRGGAQAINAIFLANEWAPQIPVHRGHSYHADETIIKLDSSAVFVPLGSCGGFSNIAPVLRKSPNAQVLSTKGTGSKWVNDPLLKMINEEIRKGHDINWKLFWHMASTHFTYSKDIENLFNNYIPPHKNISVLFLRTFSENLNRLKAESSNLARRQTNDGTAAETAAGETVGYDMIDAGDTAIITNIYAQPAYADLAMLPSRQNLLADAQQLWTALSRQDRYDPETARVKLELIESLQEKNDIIYSGPEHVLNSSISHIWRAIPDDAKVGVKEAVRAFSENIRQHAGDHGIILSRIDPENGLVYIVAMDSGPGFHPENAEPEIMDADGKFKQRPDSPGRGVALNSLRNYAENIEIYTNGYKWDMNSQTTTRNPETEHLKGAFILATIAMSQDQAMLTKPEEVGGIDLNPEQLSIQTNGASEPLDMLPLEQINTSTFTGFAPVIHTITPLFNVPQLMGFTDDEGSSTENDRIVYSPEPISVYSRREP